MNLLADVLNDAIDKYVFLVPGLHSNGPPPNTPSVALEQVYAFA